MNKVYRVVIKRNLSREYSEYDIPCTEYKEVDILSRNEQSLIKKIKDLFNEANSIESIKIKSCRSLLRYLTNNKKSNIYNEEDVDKYIDKFDDK